MVDSRSEGGLLRRPTIRVKYSILQHLSVSFSSVAKKRFVYEAGLVMLDDWLAVYTDEEVKLLATESSSNTRAL